MIARSPSILPRSPDRTRVGTSAVELWRNSSASATLEYAVIASMIVGLAIVAVETVRQVSHEPLGVVADSLETAAAADTASSAEETRGGDSAPTAQPDNAIVRLLPNSPSLACAGLALALLIWLRFAPPNFPTR